MLSQNSGLIQKNINEKARVLLLNPPTAAVSTEVLLNLAYLSAALRMNGHEVKVIDATAPHKPYTPQDINSVVREFKPHFIGVTLTVVFIAQTYDYLRDLAKLGVAIVAGGPHPTALPEEVLQNGSDIVVIGEGEDTIVELAQYFIGKKELSMVRGICYRDESNRVFHTQTRPLIEDIDRIPFADYSDFPIRNYTGSDDVDSNPIFWSVFTSRGCPYDCTFCSSHNVFGRVMRTRTPQNIVDEIKNLVDKFGAKKITFQDDWILSSKKRFIELCDCILDSRLKIKMSMRTRIDSIDKEILLKAKEVGLTRISFGIESWNDETLLKINKRYNVNSIRKGLCAIANENFPFISFNNIVGFPWENETHLNRNLAEIYKIPKSIPYFTIVVTPIPYPKTALYEQYHQKFGFSQWWLDYRKHPAKFIGSRKPFFMLFASGLCPIYNSDIFWNYSKKTKRSLEYFSWKIFSLFLKRHYKFYIAMFILFLCKISHRIWKISPVLETFIFGFLSSNKKILNLKERIVFVSKY